MSFFNNEITIDDYDPKEKPDLTAHGYWQRGIFTTEEVWDINTSDILTKLIQLAGRFAERYASDLFISWEIGDPVKKPREYEGERMLFGFREAGVDHAEWVLKNINENRYYYRKIAAVECVVEGDEITMYYKEF